MKLRNLTVALLMVAVALAGCTGGADDDGSDQGRDSSADGDSVELEAGKGAISGLLVDDRFRPIDLTDDPQTEFQTSGFILLQELGLQAQTNENGEFSFIDLDPGTYTLRIQADGHEGSPRQTTVEEGLFAEETITARRISNEGTIVLTEEYSGFTPCAASWPTPTDPTGTAGVPGAIVFGCNDSSGESYRPGPQGLDYTEYQNDTTYMVVELMVEKAGNYFLVVRHDDGSTGGGDQYGADTTDGGRYAKVIMEVGGIYDEGMNANPLDLSNDLAALNFYMGDVEETDQDDPNGGSFGNTGVDLATKSQFMISIFLGEPEVDLESYQLLSEESS